MSRRLTVIKQKRPAGAGLFSSGESNPFLLRITSPEWDESNPSKVSGPTVDLIRSRQVERFVRISAISVELIRSLMSLISAGAPLLAAYNDVCSQRGAVGTNRLPPGILCGCVTCIVARFSGAARRA